MPISKRTVRLLGGLLVFLILFFPFCVWAMTEAEYAKIAAENLRIMHETKGDAKAVMKASGDFLNKLTQKEIEEYIAMARQIMQDEELARRISGKIKSLLIQMGYNVQSASETDVNSLVIENK